MERYSKNSKPYIYAAFPKSVSGAVLKILEDISHEDGVLFWFADEFSRRERKRLRGAFGVLLFVTKAYAAGAEFHAIVDEAVAAGQNILCVYLEDVPQTNWMKLQLSSQQALFAGTNDSAPPNINDTGAVNNIGASGNSPFFNDNFTKQLKEAFIFKDMKVTEAQKKYQRNRALLSISIPVMAAVFLFFAVINPLLIAPALTKTQAAAQWGLTSEDLEKITELHIVGDQVFDTCVHAWYNSADHSIVCYDKQVNGTMQQQDPIPVGTLTTEDLSILKYMPNLKVLEIEGQQITDISPVFDTNVIELSINCNPVISLAGIEKMENLQSLVITSTDITDLTPAFSLPNLTKLQFDNTRVSSIDGAEHLQKLQTLKLENTYVTELPPFGALRDFILDLRMVPIADYSGLSNIVSFKDLSIDDAVPEELMPYIAGKKIDSLSWAGVHSLESLAGLNITEGGHIGLAWNYLTTLDGIETFEGIHDLDIHHSPYLTDITAVLNLKSLKNLVVSTDMQPLVEAQLQNAPFEIQYNDN